MKFLLILQVLLAEVYTSCFIEKDTTNCYFCMSSHYSETQEHKSSFLKTSCKEKSTTPLAKKVLVHLSSQNVNSWTLTKYSDLATALKAEGIEAQKYKTGKIEIFITIGKHFLLRKDFSSAVFTFFRRVNVEIFLLTLPCTELNDVNLCTSTTNKKAEIILKTFRFFLFASKHLKISNLAFDARDAHFIPKSYDPVSANDCYNKIDLECCTLAKIGVNYNIDSNPCGLFSRNIATTLNSERNFALFNVEGVIEDKEVGILEIENVVFDYFFTFKSQDDGSLPFIWSADVLSQVKISNTNLQNIYFALGISIITENIKLWDNIFYSSSNYITERGKITTVDNKKSVFEISALKIEHYNYVGIVETGTLINEISLFNFEYWPNTEKSINLNGIEMNNGKASKNSQAFFFFKNIGSRIIEINGLKVSNISNFDIVISSQSIFRLKGLEISKCNLEFGVIGSSSSDIIVENLKFTLSTFKEHSFKVTNSKLRMNNVLYEGIEDKGLFLTHINELPMINLNITNSNFSAVVFNFQNVNNITIADSEFMGSRCKGAADGFFSVVDNNNFDLRNFKTTKLKGKYLFTALRTKYFKILNFEGYDWHEVEDFWLFSSVNFYSITHENFVFRNSKIGTILFLNEGGNHFFINKNITFKNITGTGKKLIRLINCDFEMENSVMEDIIYTAFTVSEHMILMEEVTNAKFKNVLFRNMGFNFTNPALVMILTEYAIYSTWSQESLLIENCTFSNGRNPFNNKEMIYIPLGLINSQLCQVSMKFYDTVFEIREEQGIEAKPLMGVIITQPKEVVLSNIEIRNVKCSKDNPFANIFINLNGIISIFLKFSYIYSATDNSAIIKNVKATNVECLKTGGAITVVNYHKLSITNITSENTKAESGSHLAIIASSSVEITNCTFKNGKGSTGSSIYIKTVSGEVKIRNLTIVGVHGIITGAIHFSDVNKATLTQVAITNSKSDGGAGGILFDTCESAFLANITFSNVTSRDFGGAIQSVHTATLNFNGINSIDSSSENGGFAFIEDCQVMEIVNCNITRTSALIDGASLYANDILNLTGIDLRIEQADNGPGVGINFFQNFNDKSLMSVSNISCMNSKAQNGYCLYLACSSNLNFKNFSSSHGSFGAFSINWYYIIKPKINNSVVSNLSTTSPIYYFQNVEIEADKFNISNSYSKKALVSTQDSWMKLSNSNSEENGKSTLSFAFRVQTSIIELTNFGFKISNATALKLAFLTGFSSQVTLNVVRAYNVAVENKKGCVSLIQNSNLKVLSSDFRNSFGPIVYLEDSTLYVSSTSFANNKRVETTLASDIYSTGSNPSEIYSSNFQNSFDLSIKIVKNFKASISGLSFDRNFNDNKNGAPENMVAVELYDILEMYVNSVSMKTLNSNNKKGAGLKVFNSRNLKSKLSIQNSKFTNLTSLSGSAIYLSGFYNANINKCIFESNTAKYSGNLNDTEREKGYAGAINYFCPTFNESDCNYTLSDTNFTNNTAELYSPNLFSTTKPFNTSGNKFESNSDGMSMIANISTFPWFIRAENEIGASEVTIASGQLKKLRFQIYDFQGNKLTFDNSSVASLRPNSTSKDISMENSFKALEKSSLFLNELVVKKTPNSSGYLNLIVDYNLPFISATIPQNTTKIKLNSRVCDYGEVRSLGTCKLCKNGSYSINDPMIYPEESLQCQACPENSDCYFGRYITPTKGYWRYSNVSTELVKCLIPAACEGMPASSVPLNHVSRVHGKCSEGNYGIICHDCIKGYGKLDKTFTCGPCPDQKALIIIRIVLLLILITAYIVVNSHLFANRNRKRGAIGYIMKLALNHCQVIGIITIAKENWGDLPSLNITLDLQNYLSFMRMDFFAADCIIDDIIPNRDNVHFAKVVASLILPLILSIFAFFAWIAIILYFLVRKGSMGISSPQLQKRILISFVVAAYIFYPIIISSCFSLINCMSVDSKVKASFLYFQPNLECWDSTHTQFIFEGALPGILFWGILFPYFVYFILKKQRAFNMKKHGTMNMNTLSANSITQVIPKPSSFNTNGHSVKVNNLVTKVIDASATPPAKKEEVSNSLFSSIVNAILDEEIFRFFYDGYNFKGFYWEIVVLIKKFVLTLIASLNQLIHFSARNIFIMLVIFYNLALALNMKPYIRKDCNMLELMSLMVCLITVICAFFMFRVKIFAVQLMFGAYIIIFNMIFIALCLLFIVRQIKYIEIIKKFTSMRKKTKESK